MNENRVESADYPRMVGVKMFDTGNVVRWGGRLYIVTEHDRTSTKGEKMLTLIPLDDTNVRAGPSESWPSPEKGYQSVELVARHVKEFILGSFSKVIWPGL